MAEQRPKASGKATKTLDASRQDATLRQDLSPASLRLGPIHVRAGIAEVEAFRRETGAPENNKLPFTYPVRWLIHPDIRAAGPALIDMEAWVPIHESQSFDYERPLDLEVDYQMMVELTREFEPARLILRAEIGDAKPCLRMEMILRIIRTDGAENHT